MEEKDPNSPSTSRVDKLLPKSVSRSISRRRRKNKSGADAGDDDDTASPKRGRRLVAKLRQSHSTNTSFSPVEGGDEYDNNEDDDLDDENGDGKVFDSYESSLDTQ